MEEQHPVVVAPATVIAPHAPETVAPDTVVRSPTTTQEQDRVSEGQRWTSRTWETTQRQLAISCIWVALMCCAALVVAALVYPANERIQALALMALTFLTSTSSLVIGFYFGRTNHTKVGGVGPGDVGR